MRWRIPIYQLNEELKHLISSDISVHIGKGKLRLEFKFKKED